MPDQNQDGKGGERKLAPHVQAALTGGAQPKMPDSKPGAKPMAPHVAAATGAAQPKTQAPPPGAKPMAPHVAAATGAIQPKEVAQRATSSSSSSSGVDCEALKALYEELREGQKSGGKPSRSDIQRHDAAMGSGQHHRNRTVTYGQLAGDIERRLDEYCPGWRGGGKSSTTTTKPIGTGHLASWITGKPAW